MASAVLHSPTPSCVLQSSNRSTPATNVRSTGTEPPGVTQKTPAKRRTSSKAGSYTSKQGTVYIQRRRESSESPKKIRVLQCETQLSTGIALTYMFSIACAKCWGSEENCVGTRLPSVLYTAK
jgi:hypothetical protein